MKKLKFLLLIVLLLGASLFGFVEAKLHGVGFFEEKVHEISITSENTFTEMGDSFYNNVCTLENDMTLYKTTGLASKDFPFVGVFDGKGHTITVWENAQNSLFGYIGEGGVIKNLHIVVISADFTEKTAAVLALENAGTIVNCKITLKSANVHTAGHYGTVVSINKGTIKNVVVNSVFENKLLDAPGRKTVLGGICAYNYGEIESCISEVSYTAYPETLKDNIFSGTALNNSVGAICGINNASVKNSVSILSEDAYVADNKNKEITFVTKENRKDAFSEENLFETLGFDDDLWVFLNGEFSLISGD